MFQRIFIFLIIFTACIHVGCNEVSPAGTVQSPFFSLSAYFDQQADSLNRMHAGIEKIYFGSVEKENGKMNNPDWHIELQPFIMSDIGKPALVSEYDSIRTGDWLYYQAKDLRPSVQCIGIRFRGNSPDSVVIIRRVSNFYYTAIDTLQYNPSGNLRMSTFNKPVVGKEINFVLRGKKIEGRR